MTAYCCAMREKFLIGIIAERADLPTPIEAGEFIDFDAEGPVHPETGKPRPVIKIRFCPFCSARIEGQPVRTEPT